MKETQCLLQHMMQKTSLARVVRVFSAHVFQIDEDASVFCLLSRVF